MLRLITCLIAVCCVACSATIVPPKGVEESAYVVVLDHGRHSSLVLPVREGFVRYAFGDWRWYAENRNGFLYGLSALFLPTGSGLGRQEIAMVAESRELLEALHVGVEHAHVLEVEASKVAGLEEYLGRMHQNANDKLYSPRFQLNFAAHPQPYHLLNQSNLKVAEWVRWLGCDVEGISVLSDWRVSAS